MSITGLATEGIKSITDILNYWAEIGVFSYVLPFLLVFAVIYGILAKMNIFGEANKNKGVNAVIAIVAGALSLQVDIVPNFFSTIFPYAGVGLSILLVALILMGLFGLSLEDRTDKTARNIFMGIGALIAAVVIISSLTNFSTWSGGQWWNELGPTIITFVILGVLVWLVIGGKGNPSGVATGAQGH